MMPNSTSYLVFRLYGPMASWGQPAVGEMRYSWHYPPRSAILGLLGAALGIKRHEETRLQQLQESLQIAIKQLTTVVPWPDFHTSQVPPTNRKIRHVTRRSELRDRLSLSTILSRRDYCNEGVWIVAISLTPNTHYDLDSLQQALLHPHFTLSLGRKSCPLALPMLPKVVRCNTLKEALDSPFPAITLNDTTDQWLLNPSSTISYFWSGTSNALGVTGEYQQQIMTSHYSQQPLNRQRWQFSMLALHSLSIMQE